MWIVPAFDKIEDRKSGLTAIVEPMPDEQLAFERSIDALAHRVIITIPNGSHGRLDAGLFAALPQAIDVYWQP